MRIVFLGDIVGRTGRNALVREMPFVLERWAPDIVIVNGENAAGGFGITEDIAIAVHDLGCDVITLGNHAFDQRETLVFIERLPFLLRPVNYPSGTPGRGVGLY